MILTKRVYTVLLLVVIAATGLSASFAADNLRWLSTEYDFGTFPEAGGKRMGEVRFINEGSAPTTINRVRLTCGCTSESHTEGLVNPGDTAIVSFTYNPAGRPGRFEKSIKVYTGENNDLTTVRMRGTVIGAPQTLANDYPVEAGPLRLDSRRIDFGKVRHGTSRHHFIVLYNQGTTPLKPVWTNPGEAVDIDLSNHVIPPGELTTMSVYLNTRDEERMGPLEYSFVITPDAERSDSTVTYSILADITPDLRDMTPEELENAPRVECSPRRIETGILNTDKNRNLASYPVTFAISNQGHTDLHVARIVAKGVPMKLKRYPTSLKPGKSGRVEAVIDFRKFPAGPFNFKIEVITDDPLRPIAPISVSGEKE